MIEARVLMRLKQLLDRETLTMPLPIDVGATAQAMTPLVDSSLSVDVLLEAQSERDISPYEVIAARRAQLEDAETLRRVRAL
jgi:hypothetical protein